MEDSNDNLFKRISRGDEKAFMEMFYNYRLMLYSVARKLLYKDQDNEVDDVVYGVFAWIWENRKGLPLDAPTIGGYLSSTTRNKCIDIKRHDRMKRSKKIGYQQYRENYFFNDQLDNKDLNRVMNEALFSPEIQPRAREIFLLHFVYGIKLKNVAKKLDIDYQTAKNQVYRTVRTLRQKLKPMLAN